MAESDHVIGAISDRDIVVRAIAQGLVRIVAPGDLAVQSAEIRPAAQALTGISKP